MNKMTIDTLITYFEDFARLIEQLASDCNQLDNVAKIRQALKQIVDITMPCEGVTSTELQVNDIAYNAISAPPRNCASRYEALQEHKELPDRRLT